MFLLFFVQDKLEHLELLDGVVIDLLKTKWNTFVKRRFYKEFYTFAFYFLFTLVSFISRPGPEEDDADADGGGSKEHASANTTAKMQTLNSERITDGVLKKKYSRCVLEHKFYY